MNPRRVTIALTVLLAAGLAVNGGAVFGSPDNEAVILGSDGSATEVPRGSKAALAHVIWDQVARRLHDGP